MIKDLRVNPDNPTTMTTMKTTTTLLFVRSGTITTTITITTTRTTPSLFKSEP